MELAHDEGAVTVAVAEYPATTIAGSSAAPEMALVVVPASLPCPSLAGRLDDQQLFDELEREFDATYHLSKLSAAWADLSMGMASFGELL
jgi:hypothetical protein